MFRARSMTSVTTMSRSTKNPSALSGCILLSLKNHKIFFDER
jgi:hypothetical protein